MIIRAPLSVFAVFCRFSCNQSLKKGKSLLFLGSMTTQILVGVTFLTVVLLIFNIAENVINSLN